VLRSFGRFQVCMYWARQRRHIAQRSTTLYASSVWLPKPFHCCTLTKTTAYACMQYAGRMHAWWHALSPVRTRSLSKGAIAVLPSMFKSNPNKIHMDACLTYAATRDTNALQCSFWSYIYDLSPSSRRHDHNLAFSVELSMRCAFTLALTHGHIYTWRRTSMKLGNCSRNIYSFQ
jgi:hypothetical protein